MGVLSVLEKPGRKSPNFFTETVEMLRKNRLCSTCKFGFLLRIGHFAQDFVKALAGAADISYIIDIKVITWIERQRANASVSPR
jgi:hypothetical protein